MALIRSLDGRSEQVFSPDLHERFPKLKMINWFEWNKQGNEVHQRPAAKPMTTFLSSNRLTLVAE